jgi:hypothetical protein
MKAEIKNMRAGAIKLETTYWPYEFQLRVVKNGLLLQPKRKARAGWEKLFSGAKVNQESADLEKLRNEFDDKEWQW